MRVPVERPVVSLDNLPALIDRVRRCAADCATANATVSRARRTQDAARDAHLQAEAELNDTIRKLVEGPTP